MGRDIGRNHPSPTQANGARMGEKEKNRNQKEEQKKETGGRAPTQLPEPFNLFLRPAWITQYPILKPQRPQGEKNKIYLTHINTSTHN